MTVEVQLDNPHNSGAFRTPPVSRYESSQRTKELPLSLVQSHKLRYVLWQEQDTQPITLHSRRGEKVVLEESYSRPAPG